MHVKRSFAAFVCLFCLILIQKVLADTLIFNNSSYIGYVYGPSTSYTEMLDYGTSAGGRISKFLFGYTTGSSTGTIWVRFYRYTNSGDPGYVIKQFTLTGVPSANGYVSTYEYVIPEQDRFELSSGNFGYSFEFSNAATMAALATGGTGIDRYFWEYDDWYDDFILSYFSSAYNFYFKLYTAPPINQITCDISGHKFDDVNGNSVWDVGEPNIPGWNIYLDTNNNNQYDPGADPNVVTDPNSGRYFFENLASPATYTIREVLPDGWTQTLPGGPNYEYTIVTEPNHVYLNNNFGNTTLPPGPKITGHVRLRNGKAVAEVVISGEPGGYSDRTDDNGYYEITVANNWTGTVAAGKDRYEFDEEHAFLNLTSDAVADFTAYGIYNGGDGTEANPFRIADVVDLLALGENTVDYAKHFIQTADISLAGAGKGPDGVFESAVIARSTAGSSFNGVAFGGGYDGNGFTISDLSIDATTSRYDYLGLFGKVHNGLIENLKLENIEMNGEYIIYVGSVVGYNDGGTVRNCDSLVSIQGGMSSSYFGGIAGYNYDDGTIENCSSGGSISGSIGTAGGLVGCNDYYSVISGCNSSCDVTGNINLGGLVGINDGVSEINDSFATGNVTGSSFYYYVGGLVGDNDCFISGCYATGIVSGNREVGGLAGRNYSDGVIVNCYARGNVNGVENVGGFVGTNDFVYPGVISQCYAFGDVSGSNAVGGFCGYNTDNHFANPVPVIVNCFWNMSVQTHGVSVGIGINNELVSNVLGRTTSQMQIQSTFSDYGWDFAKEMVNGTEDIWHMPYGAVGSPLLWWQRDIPGDWTGKYGVGMEDYAVLAGSWLNDKVEMNLIGPAIIDFEDLMVFLENWLAER